MTSHGPTAHTPTESHGSLLDEVHPEWQPILAPHVDLIARLLSQVFAPGNTTLPSRENVLRVFRQPLSAIKVVIVGQDPYPTPGDAVGLSFSVAPGSKIPRSLKNIYTELNTDLNVTEPVTGDLSAWESQGVFLLNRVLTVPAGSAGGHRKLGWEVVTQAAIEALAHSQGPLVAILWGADAAKLAPLLANHHVISSVHPSPLSARRGFFGSRPFSRANTYLEEHGAVPIDWALPLPTLPAIPDVVQSSGNPADSHSDMLF